MRRFSPGWSSLAAAWAAVLVVLALWLTRTPLFLLREQLKAWQFWSLEFTVLLGLGAGLLVVRDIGRTLDRRHLMAMAALALVALWLTLGVAPRTNRIYYDEQIYQNIGQNLSDLRLAQMCNDGTVEYGRLQCWGGEYNKQPYAYPHALSLTYRLFGVDASLAFAVNAAAMALTVGAVYLAAWFLFATRAAALFSGLLIALTPQQILWSATAAVEPSASLACAAALAVTAYFCRVRTTVALVAAAAAAVYAVQFRPESLLIVPVLGVLIWQEASDEPGRTRFWWVGLLALVLLAVHVAHLHAVRDEGWGTGDARLSMQYVADNLRVNGRFYLGDERFPVVFTVLAVLGLAGGRSAWRLLPLMVYFTLFFGIFLLFYAGSYNYGADVRYSLMTYPPLALLGGLGAARLAAWLERAGGVVRGTGLVAAALAFQFLWYLPQVRATTEEAWAARADVRFAESLVPLLRGNAYVLTHNPGMFQVWGVNAGQMSLVSHNPGYLEYLASRYSDGVYLHWNFWCNVQVPVQQEFCRNTLELTPVEEVRAVVEREQRFALYRFLMASRQDDAGQRANEEKLPLD